MQFSSYSFAYQKQFRFVCKEEQIVYFEMINDTFHKNSSYSLKLTFYEFRVHRYSTFKIRTIKLHFPNEDKTQRIWGR